MHLYFECSHHSDIKTVSFLLLEDAQFVELEAGLLAEISNPGDITAKIFQSPILYVEIILMSRIISEKGDNIRWVEPNSRRGWLTAE